MMPPSFVPYAPRSTVFGGSDAGVCEEPLLKITWPSDVDDFKARLDAVWTTTDASIGACPNFIQAERDAWSQLLAGWRTFRATKTPLFGSSGVWEQTCAYSRTLDGWIEAVRVKGCQSLGPTELQGRKGSPEVVDLVRYATYAAIGVGIVTLLIVYAPEIKAFLPSRKR